MTVKELKAHLDRFPEDAEVEFYGYAAGFHFHEKTTENDFVYSEDQKKVIIQADWN